MDGIGAGTGDDVHVRARIASITGVISRGLDLEFLQRVGIGDTDARIDSGVPGESIAREVVDVDAIHLIVVLINIGAIDAYILRATSQGRRVVYADVCAGRHAEDL